MNYFINIQYKVTSKKSRIPFKKPTRTRVLSEFELIKEDGTKLSLKENESKYDLSKRVQLFIGGDQPIFWGRQIEGIFSEFAREQYLGWMLGFTYNNIIRFIQYNKEISYLDVLNGCSLTDTPFSAERTKQLYESLIFIKHDLIEKNMTLVAQESYASLLKYIESKGKIDKEGNLTISKKHLDSWKTKATTPFNNLTKIQKRQFKYEASKYLTHIKHLL